MNVAFEFIDLSCIFLGGLTNYHKAPQITTKHHKAKFVIQQERVLGTLNCKTISQGHIDDRESFNIDQPS